MANEIRVVPPVHPEVTALAQACQELAQQSAIDRFEIAVKSRLQQGIRDDNDLRLTDELNHQLVLAKDALEASAKPAVSAAYALHKSLLATVKPWSDRWGKMIGACDAAILNYKREKRELAERQQRELDRAAEDERRRLAEASRTAMREGDVVKAKAAMEEAQSIVTPIMASATPVLDNTTDRRPWEVSIPDDMVVIRGIAAGIIPLSALKKDAWDLTFLKKEAARRGGLPETWGIVARQVEALSHRR